MLAIGRGLMANPSVLLVDECSLGLSPVMAAEVFRVLSLLAGEGMTVVVVEQNISVLDYAAQAIVLEQGQVERRAAGAELRSLAQALRESYLGRTVAA
jgi:ABC-type branched-subunit amino acid transport system ATPase component